MRAMDDSLWLKGLSGRAISRLSTTKNSDLANNCDWQISPTGNPVFEWKFPVKPRREIDLNNCKICVITPKGIGVRGLNY
jgi:hypothetical protein